MVVDQVKLANKGLEEQMLQMSAMLERMSRALNGKEPIFDSGQASGTIPTGPVPQFFNTGTGMNPIYIIKWSQQDYLGSGPYAC